MINDQKICRALYRGKIIRCINEKRAVHFAICAGELKYMDEICPYFVSIDSDIPSIFSKEWEERIICDEGVFMTRETYDYYTLK